MRTKDTATLSHSATLLAKSVQTREPRVVQGIEELTVSAGAGGSVCLVNYRETGPPVAMSHEQLRHLVK